MKLADMTLTNYLDLLKSDAPAPGGGSVSALSAAQGAALVSMVCELTIPKEKFAEYKELCTEVRDEIIEVYNELIIGIDKDTDAFNNLSAAFKMPKTSEEEKAERSRAIQAATIGDTEVPYETMAVCMKGLEITKKIVGKSNPGASSDLGVAALNLLAGLKGAYLNVKINVPSIKDEAVKARFAGAEELVSKAEVLAAEIYNDVLAAL